MILAPLEILHRDCLDTRLRVGLQFLSQIADTIVAGRHELAGGAYVMVDEYITANESTHHFEAHLKHIDIHLLLGGQEIIQWCALAELNIHTPYNADDDYALYTPAAQAKIQNLVMVPKLAAVFYPADGHRPGIMYEQECAVKKAVVKVPV